MSTETTPLEVVSDEQPELAVIVRQNALPDEAAKNLQSSFAPAFTEARSILQQSRQIVVTDGSQKLQIKLAREYRLALKNVRVGADKVRKELKDESVRKGRAIDGFYAILLHLTEEEEARLDEQEKFAEVQEAKRKAALKVAREAICLPLGIDPNLYQLGEMSEETFQTLVEGTKLARAAQEAARVKAEADRIAREAADAAERERVRLENERLKKEAEEREAAAKIERERVAKEKAEAEEALRLEYAAALREQKRIADEAAAQERIEFARKQEEIAEANRKEQLRLQALRDVERQKAETAAAETKRQADAVLAEQKRKADETAAKIRSEADERARKAKVEADKRTTILKEENDRVKAQLKAEQDAQAKRAADAAEAANKLQSAPDRMKLMQLAGDLRDVGFPACATREGQTLAARASADLETLITWIETEAKKLGAT